MRKIKRLLGDYFWLPLLAVFLLLPAPAGAYEAPPDSGGLPLFFEPNQGQADPDVDFLARAPGYGVFLTGGGAVLALPVTEPAPMGMETPVRKTGAGLSLLRLEFLGANPTPGVEAEGVLPGRSNYLVGSDPAGWRTGVPHFARVRYSGVYPGVDVVWRGSGPLEYDMVLGPGADPGAIRLAIEGHSGMSVDEDGGLDIELSGRGIVHRAPLAYQDIGGERVEVEARFRMVAENVVGFEVGEYDRGRTLTIDPLVLSYSTYVGGSGSEETKRVAVDDAGMAYMTGSTTSVDFPVTPGALQTAILDIWDVYVVKIDPAKSGANSLVYATYLGSTGRDDGGLGITVDSVGRAYVTGWTKGGDFPTTPNAFKSTFNPIPLNDDSDAFITALTPTGDGLYYSTFFGAESSSFLQNLDDVGHDIALLGDDLIYLAGTTNAGTFPTTANAYDNGAGTYNSVFLSVLDRPAGTLQYSTLLHGSWLDYGRGLAVDANGRAYLTGIARSDDFPTTSNAFMPAAPTGRTGGFGGLGSFLSVIDPSKSGVQSLVYSTYLGVGDAEDVDVDDSSNAYVVGRTVDPNFPTTPGAFDTVCEDLVFPDGGVAGCAGDAFVMRIDPALSGAASLRYSTLLGGKGGEDGTGIAVDGSGNAYVTGSTSSPNFPIKYPISGTGGTPNPAFPSLLDSGYAFVAKINHTGDQLVFSTLLGGSGDDAGRFIAIDGSKAIYVAGYTYSTDFPIRRGFDATLDGYSDTFFAKITYDACGDESVELVGVPQELELELVEVPFVWEEPMCIIWDTNDIGGFTGFPRECPPLGCPECDLLPTLSRDIIVKNMPENLPPLYRELFGFGEVYMDPKRRARPAGRLAALLKEAPAGRYYTRSMKTEVLGALKGFVNPKGGPRVLSKVRGKKRPKAPLGPKAVLSKVIEAVNAIELDWRVPKIASRKVEAGKFTSVDFNGVAWAALRGVEKPGTLSLKARSGMPARAQGFRPGWPVVTYRLGFTGKLSKNGYADMSFYVGGVGFEGQLKDLRILEWDGKSYKRVPTKYDPDRGVVTGRVFFKPGYKYLDYVVVQAIPCPPPLRLQDVYRHFRIPGR